MCRATSPRSATTLEDDRPHRDGRFVLAVRRVSYAVEAARVEQRTDLDKLVMTIETNGAITPRRRSARRLAS